MAKRKQIKPINPKLMRFDNEDFQRVAMPHNEIKEALDRATNHIDKITASELSARNDYEVKQTLIALTDAIVEIAATLPAPNTVPKEEDAEDGNEPPTA